MSAAEGAMLSTRASSRFSPVKSSSSASPSGRRSPERRCSPTAMRKRIAMQERKITQPSKTCRKPSAWAMP